MTETNTNQYSKLWHQILIGRFVYKSSCKAKTKNWQQVHVLFLRFYWKHWVTFCTRMCDFGRNIPLNGNIEYYFIWLKIATVSVWKKLSSLSFWLVIVISTSEVIFIFVKKIQKWTKNRDLSCFGNLMVSFW